MAKDYTLLLKGVLDTSEIDAKIAKYNKSAGNAAISLIDTKRELYSLDTIQKRMSELQRDASKSVQVTTSGIDGSVTGQVLKYRDALGSVTTETYKLVGANEQGVNQFAQTTRHVEGSTKSLSHWTDGLSNAISRTLQYATSIGLVYGVLNQLKQGIQYIIDLNKEMTNIQVLQVDGAKTTAQIDSLALSFNNLAKELL